MKRLFLSLGTASVLVSPIVGVVSCKDDSAYSYNASDKSISLGIHASINSFGNVALSYNETTRVANTIASGLHDHTDVDKINISYSVDGDSSKNETNIVTPADMLGFLNACGSMLTTPGEITFYELDITHGFSGLISTVGDVKLKSLVNASKHISTYALFLHSENPGDTAATDEFRKMIVEEDRVTMLSYFIVWQSIPR